MADYALRYTRILAISPHTDDVELGCGGAVARFVEEGAEVFIAALSSARESLPQGLAEDTLRTEFGAATLSLGVSPQNASVFDFPVRRFPEMRQEILDCFIRLRKEIRPQLVFIPCSFDVHQDHSVVCAEGVRAFKDGSVLGYELPWNTMKVETQVFMKLEQSHIDKKWSALEQYHSQLSVGRPYFSRSFIEGLARVRGTQIKSLFAEVFEAIRVVL